METREILAEHSRHELEALLLWFYYRGPTPVLIGGWAVYYYNPYFGSVDIDLVGPSWGGQFDNLIEGFERERGYQQVVTDSLGLVPSFRKPVYVQGELVGHIEIDACTYESDPRTFHEDHNKELPYELCNHEELRTLVKLNDHIIAYVPNKSLLFLYKLKALRDREFDIETQGAILSAERLEWLRGKYIKDGSDLIALLDPEPSESYINQIFDIDIFYKIIHEFDLEFCLESVENLLDMNVSLRQYRNVERREVEKWIEKIL